SLMLLLVWLIFFMVLIKLLPILGTISGKTVKLMVLALICRSESGSAGMPRPISYAVFCLKKKRIHFHFLYCIIIHHSVHFLFFLFFSDLFFFFYFNPSSLIYTLSLHDALPICH